MQMNVVSPISYAIETIIQEGKKHLAVSSIIFGTITKNGFNVLMTDLVADVIGFYKKIIEETSLRVRRLELDYLNHRSRL